jgi:hypothetical protein
MVCLSQESLICVKAAFPRFMNLIPGSGEPTELARGAFKRETDWNQKTGSVIYGLR